MTTTTKATATTPRERPWAAERHDFAALQIGHKTCHTLPIVPQPVEDSDRPGVYRIPLWRSAGGSFSYATNLRRVTTTDLATGQIESDQEVVVPIARWLASRCPLGVSGDRIWLRETFWTDRRDPGVVIYDHTPEFGKYKNSGEYVRATYPTGELVSPQDMFAQMLPQFWSRQPSTRMPRWASRTHFRVVNVTALRLRSLTAEWAQAEGSALALMSREGRSFDSVQKAWNRWSRRVDPTTPWATHRGAFAAAWEIKHGKTRGLSWDDNPWVWKVEFKKMED